LSYNRQGLLRRAAQAVAENAAQRAASVRADEVPHGLAGRLEHVSEKLFQVLLARHLEEFGGQFHLLHLTERALQRSGRLIAFELAEFSALEFSALELAVLEFSA